MLRSVHTDPRGGDTWSTALKAQSINDNGAALWVLHPLSLFGWYPFSYPSGEMILLSGLSQCTSLEMISTVEIASIFFGIFGMFTLFLLAREIEPNDLFCVITLFAYATFVHVVGYTWNNASTRGLFIMFYPIVIYTLLAMIKYQTKRMTFSFFSTIALITLGSIHRIILLFIGIIFLPLLILVIGQYVWKRFKLSITFKWFKFIPIISLLFIFFFQILGYGYIKPDFRKYEIIFAGENEIILLLNLAASYGVRYGISAVLAPFGILLLMIKQKKMLAEKYIILISLVSTFFILDLAYFRSFFPPIAAILVGLGVTFLLETYLENNKILIVGISTILILVSTQYLMYFLLHDFFLPLVIGILGIIFFIISIILCFVKGNQMISVQFTFVMAFMIINGSYAIAVVPMDSIEFAREYPESGRWTVETQLLSEGLWLKENAQGKFLTTGAGTRGYLWSYSGIKSAASYYEVVNDPKIVTKLNPQFNFSLLFSSGQKVFDFEIPDKINPVLAEWKIMGGNHNVAQMNKVNMIIIHNSLKSSDYYGNEMVPFIMENRYILFTDIHISMFHYNNI